MGSAMSCTGMNQLSEGKQALQQGEPMKAYKNEVCPIGYTKEIYQKRTRRVTKRMTRG